MDPISWDCLRPLYRQLGCKSKVRVADDSVNRLALNSYPAISSPIYFMRSSTYLFFLFFLFSSASLKRLLCVIYFETWMGRDILDFIDQNFSWQIRVFRPTSW